MRIVSTKRVQLASPRAAMIEVEIVERGPPRRWRLKLARLLIRLAGRIARLRVRIVQSQ